ncbi:MAG TPA: PAS domain S-box protein, partial [Blastocatellia bacterium]|nr:PAS domain S-box protein [Blastocatellia bacterium]
MNESAGATGDYVRSAVGPRGKANRADGAAPAAGRSNQKPDLAGERTFSKIDRNDYSTNAWQEAFGFTRQVLAGRYDGIVAYDRFLRYATWNPFMEELTGFSAGEVLGNNPLDLFPSLRDQGVYGLLERALAGESFSAVEQEYSNPRTGRSVWISGSLSPLRDSFGTIIGVVGTALDITDRKRNEEALLRNHSMLWAVVEGATDAVFVKDLRGCYLMINQAGAQFLGKSVLEVLGKDDMNLFPAVEAEQIMADDRVIMESGTGRTFEEVGTAGGSTRTYIATKWPWRDARGNVIGLIGMSRNITEHRQAEEAARQSKRSYEALVNSIDGIVWEADPRSLQFAFVSKQAERLLGYPVERWLTEPSFWSDHLHPEDREWAVVALAEAVRETRSQDLVYRMIAADGRTIWLRDIVTVTAEDEVVKLRGVMVDVTRHKEAEQALLASEERLRTVVAGVPIILFALDRFGVFTLSEGRGLEVLGVSPGCAVGKSVFKRYPDNPQIISSFERALSGETFASTVEVFDLVFDAWCGPLRDESGEVDGVIGVAIDITEYKRAEATRNSLEQQLLQAQKMESLGRLAGGLAHDFNNLLTAIIGYGQLVVAGLGKDHRLRNEMGEILAAAYRGASLTAQLLALGRRQALVRKNIDINNTIESLSKMLGRVIGEDVELRFTPGTNLPAVNADPGQIEQVLMNLAINARDAMPSGGRLIMETRQAQFGEDHGLIHPWARPGKYVQIGISDTGEGMDSETQARIFEPFFTTKEQGKGTGLGLAVVYGIVEQHQGLLHVYSQVGFGTAF